MGETGRSTIGRAGEQTHILIFHHDIGKHGRHRTVGRNPDFPFQEIAVRLLRQVDFTRLDIRIYAAAIRLSHRALVLLPLLPEEVAEFMPEGGPTRRPGHRKVRTARAPALALLIEHNRDSIRFRNQGVQVCLDQILGIGTFPIQHRFHFPLYRYCSAVFLAVVTLPVEFTWVTPLSAEQRFMRKTLIPSRISGCTSLGRKP